MPRPPVLEEIDWEREFAGGKAFSAWLPLGENPEFRERMAKDAVELAVPDGIAARTHRISRAVRVVVFAEGWCPDVVRHVPVLETLARSQDRITTSYLMRADAPDLFRRFLTFGGEAIPKMVFLSADWVECGVWGPMPEADKVWIARGRAAGDLGKARKEVSKSYENDPERLSVFEEIAACLEIAASEAV